jgi:hypothetical protein
MKEVSAIFNISVGFAHRVIDLHGSGRSVVTEAWPPRTRSTFVLSELANVIFVELCK